MTSRYAEYDLPRLASALSATKLRNALLKARPGLDTALKNVRVNGQLRGCNGFVRDPKTGNIVYVSAEENFGSSNVYARTASSMRDYTGGRNNMTSYDELVSTVLSLLDDPR